MPSGTTPWRADYRVRPPDVGLLSNFDLIHFNAELSERSFGVGISEQKLNREF